MGEAEDRRMDARDQQARVQQPVANNAPLSAAASPLHEAVVPVAAPADQVAVVADRHVEDGGDAAPGAAGDAPAVAAAPAPRRRRLVVAPRQSLPRRAKTEALRRLRQR